MQGVVFFWVRPSSAVACYGGWKGIHIVFRAAKKMLQRSRLDFLRRHQALVEKHNAFYIETALYVKQKCRLIALIDP